MTEMIVPLTKPLTTKSGGTTTAEALFCQGRYTCPASKSPAGKGSVWHLPPTLKVVHAQVEGRLKWRAEVRRVWQGTWQQAFPAVVEPQNCPALLWILDFERVTPGDDAPSRVRSHAYK